jgi:hypothetical protein
VISCTMVSTIAASIQAALDDRDMEWWEKCCLVDNVEPTPEGVDRWIGVLNQYVAECEREKAAALLRGRADSQRRQAEGLTYGIPWCSHTSAATALELAANAIDGKVET